jgi:DNA-binding LacI/PurR family transcriptional regulator
VDQELGGRLVTEHLLAAGHSTVWHVAGPGDWLEAGARVAGWRAALEEAGAEVPEPLVGDWTPLSGYRAGQELAGRATAGRIRGRGPEVTAVFVANDQMALGVMRALREAGLSVPGRVAVAGFDDIPESEFFAPPLTTVRQDFAAVGQASIRLLVSRLEAATVQAGDDERVVIEPRLIVRGSTTSL